MTGADSQKKSTAQTLKNKWNKSFEKKRKQIKTRFNIDRDYRYQYAETEKELVLEVYSQEKKKLVMRCLYSKIGSYDTFSGVWRWAWATDMMNRKLAEDSEKIQEVATQIDQHYADYDPQEADRYHFYASNGYFFTTTAVIPDLISMALEEMEAEWFFAIRCGVDDTLGSAKNADPLTVDYLALKRIIQLI